MSDEKIMKNYCLKQHYITDRSAACLATICKRTDIKSKLQKSVEMIGDNKKFIFVI